MRSPFARIVCCLVPGALAWAHDPGLSSCSVALHPGRTEIVVHFANADAANAIRGLDADHDGAVAAGELAVAGALVRSWFVERLHLRRGDEVVEPRAVTFALEANRDLRVHFEVAPLGTASLHFGWLDDLPRGHREYFVATTPDGALVREALLQRGAASVDLDAVVTAPASFVTLGIEHVLTGYDHVTFLLGLLLVARSLRAALGVITAFTVAHSLTLSLATLDLVRLPSSLVETTIALSIVWVGVENLLVARPRARWRCTFVFGLVHGFGFASALQELGIAKGPRGVVMPLLEFNVGVELGQLAIAAIALPLFARVQQRLRIPASWLVVAAGTWWTASRLLENGA